MARRPWRAGLPDRHDGSAWRPVLVAQRQSRRGWPQRVGLAMLFPDVCCAYIRCRGYPGTCRESRWLRRRRISLPKCLDS